MKKLILIVLSLTLPVVAFATDPDSFKKGYRWGEQDIANCISANNGVYSGKPSYLILRDARAWAPRLCPSADVDSFIAGFYQAYEDNGKVTSMDDPVTRTSAPQQSPTPLQNPGPYQFQMGGGRRTLDTGSTGREGESGYKGWYGERGGAAAPIPTPPSTSTDDSLLDPDVMTHGYNSGKIFGKKHSKEEKATPDQIREFSRKFADREGYTNEGQARNSLIEGWIDGYHDGHP
jgi:hypothetical protein